MLRSVLLWVSVWAAPGLVAQQTIVLRSGNGAVGSGDTRVRHLVGPADAPFTMPFGPNDFEAARVGPAAIVTNPRSSSWIPNLPADPQSRWVTSNPVDRTALYAIDFDLTHHPGAADMTIYMSVDNTLGVEGVTNGLYLNGVEVPGPYFRSGFSGQSTIIRTNLEGMLHQGRNTLYIYARDGSGVAGLIFSIRLTVHPLLASAAFAPFGNGCAGSFGTPSLGTATGSMPWIGETLEVQLNGLPATVLNTPFGMLGFSRDFWAGSPLPMELAGLGMPGCVAFVEPHAAVPLANAGGTASWFLAVPDSPAFVGTHFYVQGAVVDFGINPANLILSNAGEALVGAR